MRVGVGVHLQRLRLQRGNGLQEGLQRKRARLARGSRQRRLHARLLQGRRRAVKDCVQHARQGAQRQRSGSALLVRHALKGSSEKGSSELCGGEERDSVGVLPAGQEGVLRAQVRHPKEGHGAQAGVRRVSRARQTHKRCSPPTFFKKKQVCFFRLAISLLGRLSPRTPRPQPLGCLDTRLPPWLTTPARTAWPRTPRRCSLARRRLLAPRAAPSPCAGTRRTTRCKWVRWAAAARARTHTHAAARPALWPTPPPNAHTNTLLPSSAAIQRQTDARARQTAPRPTLPFRWRWRLLALPARW